MNFKMIHNNLTVLCLEKSIAFYKEALGLSPASEISPADGSFRIVYLSDELSQWRLELTWYRDRTLPYNLGDNEIHLAFQVDDFQKAYAHHSQMGCICYENHDIGIYFISDPDGYWLEVIPATLAL